MNKPLVTMIALIAFSHAVAAQIANIPGVGNTVLKTKKYTEISGSAYLFDDWKPGTVTDRQGKVYANTLLKYDAYKDCIEVNQDGNVLILDSKVYPEFSITNVIPNSNLVTQHEFKSGFSTIPSCDPTNYFEVLLKNEKVTLLKRLKIDFIDQNATSYGSANVVKEFRRKEQIYLINKSQQATEIKFNKKSVFAAIGDHTDELEKFVDDNDLKVKNADSVIEILEFYSKL